MTHADPTMYYDDLICFASRRVPREDARDLVQDTYAAFYGARYTECGKMRAWLYRALRNRIVDWIRRSQSARRTLPRAWSPPDDSDPADRAVARQHAHALLCDPPLTAHQRRAVLLCYGYDYTFDEAAEVLQTSRLAVKKACERGVRAIRTGQRVQ